MIRAKYAVLLSHPTIYYFYIIHGIVFSLLCIDISFICDDSEDVSPCHILLFDKASIA